MVQGFPGRAALGRVEPEEALQQGRRVVRRARQQVREGHPAPPLELVQELAGLRPPDVGHLLSGRGAEDVEDEGELVYETRPCASIRRFVGSIRQQPAEAVGLVGFVFRVFCLWWR